MEGCVRKDKGWEKTKSGKVRKGGSHDERDERLYASQNCYTPPLTGLMYYMSVTTRRLSATASNIYIVEATDNQKKQYQNTLYKQKKLWLNATRYIDNTWCNTHVTTHKIKPAVDTHTEKLLRAPRVIVKPEARTEPKETEGLQKFFTRLNCVTHRQKVCFPSNCSFFSPGCHHTFISTIYISI